LAPAYDLVCSRIVIPDESEETALMIQGKKKRIKRKDLEALAGFFGIPEKVRFARFLGQREIIQKSIAGSFLPANLAEAMQKLVSERFERLVLG
jgi:serine/threonine-protein kinase HipA